MITSADYSHLVTGIITYFIFMPNFCFRGQIPCTSPGRIPPECRYIQRRWQLFMTFTVFGLHNIIPYLYYTTELRFVSDIYILLLRYTYDGRDRKTRTFIRNAHFRHP